MIRNAVSSVKMKEMHIVEHTFGNAGNALPSLARRQSLQVLSQKPEGLCLEDL
jgi:cysteine synthase